jgi:hypothetical protein
MLGRLATIPVSLNVASPRKRPFGRHHAIGREVPLGDICIATAKTMLRCFIVAFPFVVRQPGSSSCAVAATRPSGPRKSNFAYSAFMFAALIIGHHFSISFL